MILANERKRLSKLIERVVQNIASPTISTDTGVEAAQQIALLAAQDD